MLRLTHSEEQTAVLIQMSTCSLNRRCLWVFFSQSFQEKNREIFIDYFDKDDFQTGWLVPLQMQINVV